jgi:hypothetical protein
VADIRRLPASLDGLNWRVRDHRINLTVMELGEGVGR